MLGLSSSPPTFSPITCKHCDPSFFCNESSLGASFTQGAQYVAQKSSTTTCPRYCVKCVCRSSNNVKLWFFIAALLWPVTTGGSGTDVFGALGLVGVDGVASVDTFGSALLQPDKTT